MGLAVGLICRAASGMAEANADEGAWTIPAPPSPMIALRPRAPSALAPVSTMPRSFGPYASAALSNSTSIDGRENSTGASHDRENVLSASTSRW